MCADKEIIELDLDELDDLDDFDLSEASYQVWGFWLDDEQQVLTEVMLQAFNDPDDAVKYAKDFMANLAIANLTKPDARYYEVLVETVVDLGDYTENVATLFRDVIEI
jgi:hypothetical protein